MTLSFPIRWGVLGASLFARDALVPAIIASEKAVLHAVASRNKTVADEWKSRFGARVAYGSYDELLKDADVQVVFIPLPNSLHVEWTVRAVEAGKHVLCEKPLGTSASECERMIAAARANNVLLMEGMMYKLHPRIVKAKEVVASGVLGEVNHVWAYYTAFVSDFTTGNIRFNKELGGGCLYDLGCYCVNIVRHVMDAEPVEVLAHVHLDPHRCVDDDVSAILRFPDDRTAFVASSWRQVWRQTCEVVGTEGRLLIDPSFGEHLQTTELVLTYPHQTRRISVEGTDHYLLEVDHFSECVAKGCEPSPSPQDALGNARVIDAIFESGRTGRPSKVQAAV